MNEELEMEIYEEEETRMTISEVEAKEKGLKLVRDRWLNKAYLMPSERAEEYVEQFGTRFGYLPLKRVEDLIFDTFGVWPMAIATK